MMEVNIRFSLPPALLLALLLGITALLLSA